MKRFLWGVNGHNHYHEAYPEHLLEQQIELAADLGVKMYRINYNPDKSNMFNYMDRVTELCKSKDIEIMLVMDRFDGSEAEIRQRFRQVASHYKGKIDYIQVFNEIDNYCIKPSPDCGDGFSLVDNFDMKKCECALHKISSAIEGLKEGNPLCKAVINISYMHFGFLDYLKQHDVHWDIVGLDWYSDMGRIEKALDAALNKYDNDIIVCESNIWPDESGNYDTDDSYLPGIMNTVGNYDSRIKGYIIYQLLDETNYTIDGFERESHFGLVKTKADGTILDKKPAYRAVREFLKSKKIIQSRLLNVFERQGQHG
ncbi:MAG: glycosyl hydrolase 53 family protein [Oscillospiraceae bacterium]